MLRKFKSGTRKANRIQNGFTLVELLVVVAIIVALAAASVIAVSKFTGTGQKGAKAAELQSVQTAMDTMMADQGISTVTANDKAQLSNNVNDFTAHPVGTGTAPLAGYLRTSTGLTTTTYYYCWDGTGKIVEQDAASGACTN